MDWLSIAFGLAVAGLIIGIAWLGTMRPLSIDWGLFWDLSRPIMVVLLGLLLIGIGLVNRFYWELFW